MLRYFLRRLCLIVPTFIGITIVCFAITQFVPGGPVEQRLAALRGFSGGGEASASASSLQGTAQGSITEQMRKSLEEHYGFDKPIAVRYWRWLTRERCGLRTHSYQYTDKTAWQLIKSRIPVSLWFGIPGFFLTYLVCIPLGIAKAVRNGTRFDFVSSLVIFALYAIPAFALGMVLRSLLCGVSDGAWDLFPLGGLESDGFDSMSLSEKILDRIRHTFLPVVCYMSSSFAMLTLLMKNSLLDQMGANYIRTVIARGSTMRHAVWAHALRNALIPIATGFGGVLTILFAGSVIIENIFEIPGMGRLSLEALETRDYPLFLGLLSVTSILGLLGQVLSDACYVLIDPRIRFDKR